MMYLSILWHMHQPCYVINGIINTPVPVFRTLFNYYPMAVMAERFPSVKLNFNFTPVLLIQIEGISSGRYKDRFLSLLVEEIGPNEISGIARKLPSRILKRHPNINILLEKIENRSYSSTDISDIKVLLHLACFHPVIFDEEIEQLFKKGRHFSREEKELLYNKEKKILNDTIAKYRKLMEDGQIEISTSPMMHPILPLLYNTDIAKRTKTTLPIPDGLFSFPEDARTQIVEGIKTYQRLFNRNPMGMWPSEGGLSNEILELFAENQVLWTATDENILSETLSKPLLNREHHNIWKYKDSIFIFFRDHHISDLIGFSYQKMEEKKSALHLFEYIKNLSESKENNVISIILDGENPWDFYPDYGTYFLPTLYEMLGNCKSIETIKFSEVVNKDIPHNKLESIAPGSWMGVNFDNWIGKEASNRAWTILKDARIAAEERINTLDQENKKRIMEYIMLAEASDWFWWYSLPVEKEIKREFDKYFRNSIKNIYETAGLEVPEFLAAPVEEIPEEEQLPYITPRIDGKITHFYEWHNAISVDVSSLWVTFKPVDLPVKKVFYGYDENNLYIRIDTTRKEGMEFILFFCNSIKKTFIIKYGEAPSGSLFFVWDEIIEIKIPKKEILQGNEKIVFFNITVREEGEEKGIVIPAVDYFKIRFGEREEDWIV